MESNAEVPVKEGEILADKYLVEKVLGQGGMGVVVAATHRVLGDRVALKFLLPAATRKPEVVARFLREAQNAVRIKSENVARVMDVGTLPSGLPYMVMEHLSGSDLGDLIAREGRLPIPVGVDYTLQACRALAVAHRLGIIHRDLKPSNLFLHLNGDGSQVIKLLDFGISKATQPDEGVHVSSLTETGNILGSPIYMSPEQIQSPRQVDARSDIWSLGIVLHELLSGSLPFQTETLHGLLAGILTQPPVRLRHHLPEAPEGLEAVILRCLAREPAARWQNVAEVAEALLPFAPERSRLSVELVANTIRGAGSGAVRALSTPPPGPTTEDEAASTLAPRELARPGPDPLAIAATVVAPPSPPPPPSPKTSSPTPAPQVPPQWDSATEVPPPAPRPASRRPAAPLIALVAGLSLLGGLGAWRFWPRAEVLPVGAGVAAGLTRPITSDVPAPLSPAAPVTSPGQPEVHPVEPSASAAPLAPAASSSAAPVAPPAGTAARPAALPAPKATTKKNSSAPDPGY